MWEKVAADEGVHWLLDQPGGVQLPGLSQALPLNMLFSCVITLAQHNDRMSKMKHGSFYGLGILVRPLWSVLPLEVMLSSMVLATAGICAGVPFLCCYPRLC